MKPQPFRTATDAVNAARKAGLDGKPKLITVDSSIAESDGFVVDLGWGRLLAADGQMYYIFVETIKDPKGDKPGKWRLSLERGINE